MQNAKCKMQNAKRERVDSSLCILHFAFCILHYSVIAVVGQVDRFIQEPLSAVQRSNQVIQSFAAAMPSAVTRKGRGVMAYAED
jgi:hypothetical protein